MKRPQLSIAQALQLHRSGQLSTTAIVFIILGICFFLGVIVIGVLAALLIPAISQARAAAERAQSQNNLKMIGLAMHNYHDTYNMLPPGGIYTADNIPYNSWMTSLLPYMEQSALFNSVDFNQPWSAPANQQVFTNTVPFFLQPSAPPETFMVGPLAAAHYAGNSKVLQDNSGMSFRDVTDGLSNTILGGEVRSGIRPWGDPANRRDPAAGIGGGTDQFGSMNTDHGGANMLMMDGAVRFVSDTVSPEVMEKLADPDGGDPVGDF